METFGKLCFFVFALAFGAIVGGFVFMNLWGWFIVPLFGLPTLTLIQSIGLVFTIKYLTTTKDWKKEKKDEKEVMKEVYTSLIMGTIGSFLVLGLGWIITLFA